MLDILIKNGEIVDGSGAPRYRADVAIWGDRIVDVGHLQGAQAKNVIDATGCAVAPGFIDMHSHSDLTLPVFPTADSMVHQGITTAVTGQCGLSAAPLKPEYRQEMVTALQALFAVELPAERWTTFASYLDFLTEIGTSVNVVPLVAQGMVRASVMGFAAGPANAEQLARMQEEVIQAMDAGAVGVSTGLIYPPGSFASTEELIAVTRPAAERGGLYFSHIRGESGTLLEAIGEAIRIGAETGAGVHISHFKAAGREHWHKASDALALLDQARAKGMDVTADMYPYLAGSTFLKSMLPEWAQDGGDEATLKRLADPQLRPKLVESMKSTGFFSVAEWDKVLIGASPLNTAYEGRYIAELAAAAGKSPYDWLFDALLETKLSMMMIIFMMSEENVALQLRHPVMMVGTDGAGLAAEGPLSKGFPHPRNFGTFPRVLGHYVREQGVLSLEEAIHKMTGLPARKLRWTDRGLVQKGYYADLVVFDPHTVADQATYEAPCRYPAGISHVIVNGQPVLRAGVHTQARPGKVLRRH